MSYGALMLGNGLYSYDMSEWGRDWFFDREKKIEKLLLLLRNDEWVREDILNLAIDIEIVNPPTEEEEN